MRSLVRTTSLNHIAWGSLSSRRYPGYLTSTGEYSADHVESFQRADNACLIDCSRALQHHLISRLDDVTNISKLKRVVEVWREQEEGQTKEQEGGLAGLVHRASIEVKELLALYILATEWHTEIEWSNSNDCEADSSLPAGYNSFFGRLKTGVEMLNDMV
jgi:hypothetical protein